MKNVIKFGAIIIFSCAILFSLIFADGLISNPIGNFTGFKLNHQHSGWGTSIYYPKIDPQLVGNKEVKVAVIDSGISKQALDEINIVKKMSFADQDPYDFIGHGTKIASIIGARDNHMLTIGVAPNVAIYSYKVTDSKGIIKQENIIKAINQAILDDVDIINLSMIPKEKTEKLTQVIKDFLREGKYFFTPAYNLKQLELLNPLGEIEGVTLIGIFNDMLTVFNPQNNILYYAPYSQEALSLNNQIVRVDGSSYSTAFVSGTVANILSQNNGDAVVHAQLEDLFSKKSVDSQKNFSIKTYEKYEEIIIPLYSILGGLMIVLGALVVVMKLNIAVKQKAERKTNVYQVIVLVSLLVLIGFLILPTQM